MLGVRISESVGLIASTRIALTCKFCVFSWEAWYSFNGGLIEIGYPLQVADPLDVCFDNDTPRHKVYLGSFQIANRKVTRREYLEFMLDDAYTRSEFWLSKGWETLKQ